VRAGDQRRFIYASLGEAPDLRKDDMLAYFDCFSGISGDMTLGALADLGVPVDWLADQLSRMPLENFSVTMNSVHRNGIHAKLVNVTAIEDNTSRNFSQIRALIENSPLSDRVKSTSLQIFQNLAEAEAQIHSCPLEEVHFHEVGGIDAIVDIVDHGIPAWVVGFDLGDPDMFAQTFFHCVPCWFHCITVPTPFRVY